VSRCEDALPSEINGALELVQNGEILNNGVDHVYSDIRAGKRRELSNSRACVCCSSDVDHVVVPKVEGRHGERAQWDLTGCGLAHAPAVAIQRVVLREVRIFDFELVALNIGTTAVGGHPTEIQKAVVSLNQGSRHLGWACRRSGELNHQVLREGAVTTGVVRSHSELEVPAVVQTTDGVSG
jgi:hypothetical protein